MPKKSPNKSVISFNIADPIIRQKVIEFQNMDFKCYLELQEQQRVQVEMRKYIKNNFDVTIMSDVFALAALYICNLTNVLTNKDILKNCKLEQLDRPNDGILEKGSGYQCICCHNISPDYIFRLTNEDTGKWIDTGSDCILKEELITNEKFKKWADEIELIKKEISKKKDKINKKWITLVTNIYKKRKQDEEDLRHRIWREEQERILSEKKERILSEKKERILMELEEKNLREVEIIKQLQLNYNPCLDCSKYNVDKNISYKTRCNDCYAVFKAKEKGNLQCDICLKYNVPKAKYNPKYKNKYCFNCNPNIKR